MRNLSNIFPPLNLKVVFPILLPSFMLESNRRDGWGKEMRAFLSVKPRAFFSGSFFALKWY